MTAATALHPAASTPPRRRSESMVRLAKVLGDAGSGPADEGARLLVRAVRGFTAATAVAMVVRPSPAVPATAFVETSPGLHVPADDVIGLLPVLAAAPAADDGEHGHVVDLAQCRGTEELGARHGLWGVLGVPLGPVWEEAGALFVLDSAPRPLQEREAIGLRVAAAVGSGLATRLRRQRMAEESSAAACARLTRHALEAAEVQDLTGNGIAVAVGWLDALAANADDEGRRLAADAAGRRLMQVQSAVNDLVESTARSIIEAEAPTPIDISALWRDVVPFSAAVRGSGSPIVIARASSLREFLARTSSILVPEFRLDGEHLRVEVINPTLMDLESRTLLWASEGTLGQGYASTHAVWRLARPWRLP